MRLLVGGILLLASAGCMHPPEVRAGYAAIDVPKLEGNVALLNLSALLSWQVDANGTMSGSILGHDTLAAGETPTTVWLRCIDRTQVALRVRAVDLDGHVASEAHLVTVCPSHHALEHAAGLQDSLR